MLPADDASFLPSDAPPLRLDLSMESVTTTTGHDVPAARASPPPTSTSPRASIISYAFPSMPANPPGTSHAASGGPTRRRPVAVSTHLPSPDAAEPSAQGPRRRSSTLSDFSLVEAQKTIRHGTQDILNPSPTKHVKPTHEPSSYLSSLPLAFALLPALFGVLFEGGTAFITDVMLLALVFIFLRYTITQPWQWYHEAQEIRIKQEVGLEYVFEDESEADMPHKMTASITTLDEVPEETSQGGQDNDPATQTDPGQHEEQQARLSGDKSNRTRVQEVAVSELYVHEVLALLSCFISPILGAYLLHTIRAQLTQRSEGLLTDFNITVFLLAAELRPMSHALKLIQARTLYLQRIVQSTPLTRTTADQLEEMRTRLAQLEVRAEANEEATAATLASTAAHRARQQDVESGSKKQEAAIIREVRNAIQPELDALNRAVRRYEKKATLLAMQTDSRLGAVDLRLGDAIALAAAAAKQSTQSHWGFGAWAASVAEWVVSIITAPYHLVMFVLMWPFTIIAGFCFKGRRRSTRDGQMGAPGRPNRHSSFKGAKNGSGSEKDRYRDRVPSRLSRRYSP